MTMTDQDVVELVARERIRRGLSIRAAARMGGVGTSTWSDYEKTGNLTPRMMQAITTAFSWTPGWHERNGATPGSNGSAAPDDLTTRVALLEVEIVRLRRVVRRLAEAVADALPQDEAGSVSDDAG